MLTRDAITHIRMG